MNRGLVLSPGTLEMETVMETENVYTKDSHAFLFELRFKLGRYDWKTSTTITRRLVVRAFEAPRFNEKGLPTGGPHGHTRLDILATLDGKVLFPVGATYVGIPFHASIDGIYAKEAVASCIAMKPGDTDEDYFAKYTEEQRKFAELFGEELQMQISCRWHDENGEVKGGSR